MSVDATLDLCHTLGVAAKSSKSKLLIAYADMVERRAVRDGLATSLPPATIAVAPEPEALPPEQEAVVVPSSADAPTDSNPVVLRSSQARFHPPLHEIDHLATPLVPGERRVLELLVERLDDEWDVFVQPRFLDSEPDFLLVSRRGRATAIEVKDWAPSIYRSSNEVIEVLNQNRWSPMSAKKPMDKDPLLKAHHYRQQIDQLAAEPTGRTHHASIHGVVVLPQWDRPDAQRLLNVATALSATDARFIAVCGQEIFGAAESFDEMVIGRRLSRLPQQATERLRDRLRESESVADQRRPIRLSGKALEIAENKQNTLIRRVRGSAGSGKSVALAWRAAQLAAEGKHVLVLGYNKTLPHYLQDLVHRRAREIGADSGLVRCTHFHGFCRSVLSSSEVADGDVVGPAIKLYEQWRGGLPTYDAILVDEGQDFRREWWNFLRTNVRRNEQSEMLLVADTTQDIYGVRSWVDEDAMPGCGFNGDWLRLPGTYRLPPDLVPVVAEFAAKYVSAEVELPSMPPDRSKDAAVPTRRRWVNVSAETAVSAMTDEIDSLLNLEGAPSAADVVYLTNEHAIGVRVADLLRDRGHESEHIFSLSEHEQSIAKARFWPGRPRLKGCTVHSFKGWESRAVVVLLQGELDNRAELAYVALTRVRGHPTDRSAFVTVINTYPDFNEFGARFERPIGADEIDALAGQTALDLN